MIVKNASIFPTDFAIMVAEDCGLLIPEIEARQNAQLYIEQSKRLSMFQRMALYANYDQCLLAYFKQDLDDRQISCLQFIFDNTKTWMLSEVCESLLQAIKDSKGRDTKELIEVFNTTFITKSADEKLKKSLLVRLTGLPSDQVKAS